MSRATISAWCPIASRPAPSAPHRRRDRMVEGLRRGTAGCSNDVAEGFQRQALRIFELPELAGEKISTLESEPTPYRPALFEKQRRREGAIAEISFGDRAEAGGRAARRAISRVSLSVMWVAWIRHQRLSTSALSGSHSTGRAPDHEMQSSTSFTCSAVDVGKPSPPSAPP